MPNIITEFSKDILESRSDVKDKIIMCAPTYFDVVDVKNAHMQGQVGLVDTALAKKQWQNVKAQVEAHGYTVYHVDPVEDLEDMVFAANAALAGQNKSGDKIAVLANMVHESRQKEIPSFGNWFESQGYRVVKLDNRFLFEGNGDAIWHPGKSLIWGGYGFRTKADVFDEISNVFEVPVCVLTLQNENFYHLDTCLCPLDENTALYCPEAFDAKGIELIKQYFSDPIAVSFKEAKQGFACNSLVLGKTVFINSGNEQTVSALKERDYKVVECDVSEFLKSGGSVCCMKLKVY